MDIDIDLETALNRLRTSIPSEIDAARISYVSKLPFTLSVWEASLKLRALELAESSLECFNQGRLLPATVLSRSLMETAALYFWMTQRISKVNSIESAHQVQEFVFRGALGSRNWPEYLKDYPESLNAISAVDKVAVLNPKFRKLYDQLCEHAHPNQEGTLMSFSLKNEETHISRIGRYLIDDDWLIAKIAVVVAVLVILESFDDWQEHFKEFVYWSDEGCKSGVLT